MAGELPSQTKNPHAAKVFSCPSCGAGVVIRAQGLTVSVVCGSCKAVIDATNENYRVISEAKEKIKVEPLIPLGTRGKLHGTLWEVIGFMRRSDGTGEYRWSEYLLFNPFKGFRWLTEFDGHWNYVIQTKEKLIFNEAEATAKTATCMNKNYSLFHEGKAKVIFVVGEFYWRVKVGEEVRVRDFICPPEILSCEISKDEKIWSIGEYIEPQTVRDAFKVTQLFPIANGVAPNQPSSYSSTASSLGGLWAFFGVFLFALQLYVMATAKNSEVYNGSFIYKPDDTEKQKVSPQFELQGDFKNVNFRLYSPVQNSWLEVEGDLVNDQTGDRFEFEQGVEFYSGVDSDGSWSEGSHFSNRTLSSIPAGLYHLNVQATGPLSNQWDPKIKIQEQTYSIQVTRDVVTWSNFLWSLVYLSIIPVFVIWRARSFEASRWSASDYSPYWSLEKSLDADNYDE